MRRIIYALPLLLLVSCEAEAINTERKLNGIEVEYLFEKDGIKVYRFYDNGHNHYFTSNGQTMSTQSNGKSTHLETIQ